MDFLLQVLFGLADGYRDDGDCIIDVEKYPKLLVYIATILYSVILLAVIGFFLVALWDRVLVRIIQEHCPDISGTLSASYRNVVPDWQESSTSCRMKCNNSIKNAALWIYVISGTVYISRYINIIFHL